MSAINDARTRRKVEGRHDFVLHLFCPDSDCAARQITMRVKEYGATVPDILHCPACRSVLAIEKAYTYNEQVQRDDEYGRASVNRHLYQKKHCRPTGPQAFPTSALDPKLPEMVGSPWSN